MKNTRRDVNTTAVGTPNTQSMISKYHIKRTTPHPVIEHKQFDPGICYHSGKQDYQGQQSHEQLVLIIF